MHHYGHGGAQQRVAAQARAGPTEEMSKDFDNEDKAAMAALCTAAAAAQHVVNFQKGIGQQEFVGEGVTHKAHASTRKKRFITACVVTTAVVEQDIEVKPTSSSPALSLDSPETSSTPDSPVLKPSPRPVAGPRPPPSPRPSPVIVDSRKPVENNTRPTRPNGAKPMVGESSYRQVFRPGDSPGKSDTTSATAKSSVDSLGKILEKAEKLKEQKTSFKEQKMFAAQKESTRFVKSTWRKGVGLETPPPADATASGSVEMEKGSGSATMANAPSVTSPVQVEVKRPELRGPPLKPPLKPLPNQEQPQKKQVILKDIGAKDQGAGAGRSATAGKAGSKPAASAPADPFPGPVKAGKAGASKGKDSKEDWRKKSSSTDGLKRRVGTKASKPDDAADVDIPGTAVGTRRGGRKMTKATRKAAREQAALAAAPVKVDILEIGAQGMSVPDLAQKLAVNDSQIIKTLFLKGIATTVNQTLDEETIKLVCEEFGVEVVEAGSLKLEDMAKKTEFLDEDDLDNLQMRPPVVTIMGHVDHGKTSLLDYIRKTKVAAGEAGGITQGIGAYRVPVIVDGEEQSCVFLDTPGHQAFTAMRARGARVTDVAVIVVAADDGVKPQTEEAIAHARAANVPIIVAINKIDKDGAEPARVMQELSGIGLMPEDWGGDIPMVQVSALKGQNVDSLLETVMLVAEFQELKANPNRRAKGTVIESRLDKTKGVLATLLVQNGTLKKGDVVLCGEAYGKMRALLDHSGDRVETAGPSTAVQVFGLSSVPVAGEEFEVLDSLEAARERAEKCGEATRLTRLAAQAAEGKVTLASLATSVAEGKEGGVERHQLNVILKADVQGTLEAIREALKTLPQDTVNLRMLLQAAGDVTVSDVDLAIASEGVIIGFNVDSPSAVQTYAENKGVEIRHYKVIYELIDDIRDAMEGLLDVVQEEVPIGKAEVRAIFVSGSGKVAGCMVTEGKLVKGCGCKIRRGSAVVYTGNLVSLRRVKELAKEVVAGLECGVGLDDYNEWQEGDIIEAFNLVAKKRTLEEASVTTASSLAAVAATASAIVTKPVSTSSSVSSPTAS
ncbi:hypothetical protein GOP47_0017465 [Adiantum capillus-veneris]|uniref:Translation initiation factor IF-2, chloroplastic n=1 Tax=Adiantum capillus-veneris TaxID=13818 RepID=A0A9D4ZAL7_ADICA|nr:hypothetical protein GOP47_0017465 [Adiantum capillus-veneris]